MDGRPVTFQLVGPADVTRMSHADEDREYLVIGVRLSDRPSVKPSRDMRIRRDLNGGLWRLVVDGNVHSYHPTLRRARNAASRVEYPEYI